MKRWRTQPERSAEPSGVDTPALDATSQPVDKNRARAAVSRAADQPTPSSASDTKPGSGNRSQDNAKPVVSIKPLDIVVPGQIGRYTIGRRIGSGTCGVVHQSLDNLLGREVAVKLSPVGEAHVSTGKVPGAQRAYQTEIIAAGRLTHPNIVTVYDAGQFEDLNFLVMEAVDGKSLKEYGKGKTLLPVGEALRIICACCHALDYSHKQGILHRDIKPANIMLSFDGSVKLLDFGIAVGLDEGGALKKQGPTLGTPNYMSPEQILGKELLAQSDFYSLATVLFELLTGRQLFKAKKVKDLFRTVVHKRAPRLTAIRPDLPDGLGDVLAKALEKKPKARYQTGKAMAKALEPFLKTFRAVEQRPLPQQRLIKKLRQQTFFKVFSDMEVALLLERVRLRNYAPGENMLNKGDQDRRLLIITDGVAACSRNGRFSVVVATGECIGETGFINGIAEPRSYHALTQVSALEVSTEALAKLPPKVHLHYYRHVSDILVDRLARGDSQMVDIVLSEKT
ncbi:MAG: protein kinase [Granulosicoccus sp.]